MFENKNTANPTTEKQGDVEIRRLETVNYKLRYENGKLESVNQLLIQQCKQQKEDLVRSKAECEEATRIKVEQGKKFKDLQNLKENTEVKNAQLQKDNSELRKKYEESRKANERLRKKISERATTTEAENHKRKKLEEEIQQKRIKLKQKSDEIDKLKNECYEKEIQNSKLKKDLKTEREKCSDLNSDLTNLQKRFKDTCAKLEEAEEKVEKKRIEHLEFLVLLSSQFKRGKENEEKIKAFDENMETLKTMISSQKTMINQQCDYICELESRLDMMEMLSDSLEQNKTLIQKCKELETENKSYKEKEEMTKGLIVGQKVVIEQHAELKEAIKEVHADKKHLMEKSAREMEAVIESLKLERNYLLAYINQLKISSGISQNENFSLPILNQLSDLKVSAGKNVGIPESQCEFMDNNIKVKISPSISPLMISTAPPPPSISDTPSTSTTNHSATTTFDSSGNDDPFFNEIFSMETPSKPKRSKKVVKAPLRKRKLHGEDISRHFPPGRGNGQTFSLPKYYCFCGERFRNKEYLDVHIKKTNQYYQERNFKCHFCPRKIPTFGHLKQHERVVHQNTTALEGFVKGCRSCGKLFETREQHRDHNCPKLIGNDFQPKNEAAMEIEVSGPEAPLPSTNPSTSGFPSPAIVVPAETDEDIDVELVDLTDDSPMKFKEEAMATYF